MARAKIEHAMSQIVIVLLILLVLGLVLVYAPMSQIAIVLLILFVVGGLVVAYARTILPSNVGSKISIPYVGSKTSIPFAKVIDEQHRVSFDTAFAGFMLIVFSVVAAGMFIRATNAVQEVEALLIWIGSSTFWGIFIIAGVLRRKQTHIVYSDIAMNLEKNIARLAKMQEQASSLSAVADAIKSGPRISAESVAQRDHV
jgi:hypothetical protein